MTYNEFCHSVWGVCEQHVTRLWDLQSFSFSAQDDAWEYSWTGRTGIPLTDFEKRWNTLTTYTYEGPTDVQQTRNVDLKNTYFLDNDPAKTGGAQAVIDEITCSIAHRRIKAMARQFHQTYPGDWEAGYMPSLGGRMRAYYERDEYGEDASDSTFLYQTMIGHGNQRNGDVTLYPQHASQKFLSKAEMIAALSALPPHVRLLIVNEACYSGTWATIAPDVSPQRDVLVETAATLGEKSWTYSSGRNRCSLFGAAFVEELTTHPEGRIDQHRSRIVDEMLHVGPDQETSTPLVVPSARALFSHNISHFVLSPRIATDRHEKLLQSRTSAWTFWRKMRRRINLEREPAQDLPADSPASDRNSTDMKAIVIENYLKDLGPLKSALDYCTLATACQVALKGRGPPD
ncbi:hypothetical protein N7486_008493 [Penicillium sp. IBT 16267x]|nr:hypothetical protein N7486_008493 [Penicillium sp. IBT 16267x]